jgi:hypothetical protein
VCRSTQGSGERNQPKNKIAMVEHQSDMNDVTPFSGKGGGGRYEQWDRIDICIVSRIVDYKKELQALVGDA